jgi:hypothetical protein
MATTYLELVNAVNRRFNEVELSASNFAGAIGHYGQVKDAVNAALNELYSEQIEWPFLRVQTNQVLTAYQTRYDFPADYKYPDIESFRLRYDDTLGTVAKFLVPISYDHYLQNYSMQESHPDDSFNGIPSYCFYGPNAEWGVVPKPNAAYTIDYEYMSQPADLVAHDDEMVVPDAYKYVVLQGAEHYTHMFRDNMEASDRAAERFKKGIKDMRKVLINRNDDVRSTMRPWTGFTSGAYI